MSDQGRKICIVLDTNEWRSSHGLHSPLAASLVHAAFLLKAVIGLPEVVERELKVQWQSLAQETLEAARKLERILAEMMGKDHEEQDSYLPTMERLEGELPARLDELKPLIERVPLTLEHTHRSLDRIDNHLPPSGKENEQFRDGAIWEAVLELAAKYDVHFVTKDGRFFESKGGAILTPNLAEDCTRVAGGVTCHRSIEGCLDAIKASAAPIPEREMAEGVANIIRDLLREKIRSAQFALAELKTHSVKSYATGKPKMALSFSLTFTLTSPRDDRLDSELTVSGDCLFDLTTKVASDPELQSQEIAWSDSDGMRHRARPRSPIYAVNSGYGGNSSLWQETYHRRSNANATIFSVYGNADVSPPNINLIGDSATGLFGSMWEEY